MRTAYRIFAYLMALEVVVQAAAIAFAMFGLGQWIQEGGVLDKAAMESEGAPPFAGVYGFMVHGMNGTLLVPLIALLLLAVSLFVKVPRAVAYAGVVVGCVALQVVLGTLAHSVPALGMLHGAIALVLLVAAIMAGRLVARAGTEAPARHASAERV